MRIAIAILALLIGISPTAAQVSACEPMTYSNVASIIEGIAERTEQKTATEADVAMLRKLARCMRETEARSRKDLLPRP